MPGNQHALRELDRADLEHLATGSWVLGTGGGSSPYMSLLNMRRLYEDGPGAFGFDLDYVTAFLEAAS